MAGNGGPWGGGGDNRGNGGGDNRGGRKPGGEGPQIPEIDDLVKKGQEQLRVLMGGRGPGGRGPSGGGGGNPLGPIFTRQGLVLGGLAAVALWLFASFYTVRPEERSVELFLGEFSGIGQPGLNFAPWPIVSAEIVQVTGERNTDIGTGRLGALDTGLMLTRDQNIVDIEF
ncbi:MAG: HflK protein, partial [Gemmobacter sp.]